jgi:hypothetical protein
METICETSYIFIIETYELIILMFHEILYNFYVLLEILFFNLSINYSYFLVIKIVDEAACLYRLWIYLKVLKLMLNLASIFTLKLHYNDHILEVLLI